MTPRLRLAQAARHLVPQLQGSLDGLCGLYTIINAVELAIYPDHRLKPAQRKLLFARGVRFLSARRKLHTTITSGMTDAVWIDLAEHMLKQNADLPARSELLRVGHDLTGAVRAIKGALKRGQPVALSLNGAYDHFTVIWGFSQARFLLFDSYGYRTIAQRTLGLAGQHDARHRITRTAVLVFMRA